ncbi:potassium channel family protein [Streptomyces specialis]|uniref:potassium channel family protein n=1 Tax=Streptomyces specialis TaxID=498367 RepID=UPI00073F3CDD|nr:potassium channel family protein [Streptomyces specialis]
MFGFAVLAAQLVAAVRRAWRDAAFRGLAVSLVVTVVTAVVFYRLHEGWTWLDSVYFSVTTGLTIGYGDLAPSTALSKMFTMAYALSAVSLFVSVAGLLTEAAGRSRRERPRR